LTVLRLSLNNAEVVRPLGLALALILAGCGGAASHAPATIGPAGRLHVVTTSNVFADMIENAGGDRVTVTSLVPKGADVHTYQATPQDLRAAASADLFVMNGLGLDDWLAGTIESASSRAPIIRLGVDLPGVTLLPGESPGTENPHLWMDVAYGTLYATRISDALRAADRIHATEIGAASAAYLTKLAALDAWVRQQVEAIPSSRRLLVTFHDALPYFARAYGLTVVGVAVDAPGQDPSAGEIAALIDAIRTSGVKAIFSESQFPTALVDQLARETGTRVVANLYDDTLGQDPVTSYEAMIRWDTQQIVEALK
jgi:zinc/manganese transport system substrate-binding protein/manganese/iron transport system substrate-binding protein